MLTLKEEENSNDFVMAEIHSTSVISLTESHDSKNQESPFSINSSGNNNIRNNSFHSTGFDVEAFEKDHVLPSTKHQVLIGNLTWWTTDEDIFNALVEIGVNDFVEVSFENNRTNGQSKGNCIVTVGSEASVGLIYAKLDKKNFHGQIPVVMPPNKDTFCQAEAPAMVRPSPLGDVPATTKDEHGGSKQVNAHRQIQQPNAFARVGGSHIVLPNHDHGPQEYNNWLPHRQIQPNSVPCMAYPQSSPRPFMMMQSRPNGPIRFGSGPMRYGMIGYPGSPRIGWTPPLPFPMNNYGPPRMFRPPGVCPMNNYAPQRMFGPPPVRMGNLINVPILQYPGEPSPSFLRQPRPHMNPLFFQNARISLSSQIVETNHLYSGTSVQSILYHPPSMQQQEVSNVESDTVNSFEFDEIMLRNRKVSSAAISRALSDVENGEIRSGIEILVTAITVVKQSKISHDIRCNVLVDLLEDTLKGIELEANDNETQERSKSQERERNISIGREKTKSPGSPKNYRDWKHLRHYVSDREYSHHRMDKQKNGKERERWMDKESREKRSRYESGYYDERYHRERHQERRHARYRDSTSEEELTEGSGCEREYGCNRNCKHSREREKYRYCKDSKLNNVRISHRR